MDAPCGTAVRHEFISNDPSIQNFVCNPALSVLRQRQKDEKSWKSVVWCTARVNGLACAHRVWFGEGKIHVDIRLDLSAYVYENPGLARMLEK